jgi:spore germination protein YaaH
MRPEVKLTLYILAISLVLAIAAFIIKQNTTKGDFLSPFSQDLNIFSFFGNKEKPKKIIYGYLPFWSLDEIEYLQLNKLTDIAYFGLNINEDGSFQKTGEPGYNHWINNKELHKLIKKANARGIRFAVTVISQDDEISDKFLDCRECWGTLVKNLKSEMNKNGVKHVNLNFEYSGDTAEDKATKYVELIDYVNREMDKTYGDSFTVTAAFADSSTKPRVTSELDALGKAADAVFIMAYDFHRTESEYAGPVAPINDSEFDLKDMLKDYLSVISPNKLIMGVPYYGYNWVVYSDDMRAERREGNDEIGYSQSQIYSKVMDDIATLKPQIEWDAQAQEPYFHYVSPETNSLREVYFENEKSLKAKYELAKENKLAGIGIWALGYDGGYTNLWKLLYEEFIKN